MVITRTLPDDNVDNTKPAEQQATVSAEYSLAYKIFRPMALSSRKAAPILVLHGGPSIPSDYLYPLVNAVEYRSIVFYDQIGCGKSSQPDNPDAYSIDNAVDDLEALLKKLGLRRFHLYGQSFGGILAFEYMKRVAERKGKSSSQQQEYEDDDDEGCLSVILSSAPTSVKTVEEEAGRLLALLKDQDSDESTLNERFRVTHQCRTSEMPTPLVDAYARAGTVWRGTDAIQGYQAMPVSKDASRMPSAMVMRGEHDFVTASCCKDWKETLWNHQFVKERILEGCSHHGLLEQEQAYGEVLEHFFAQYD